MRKNRRVCYVFAADGAVGTTYVLPYVTVPFRFRPSGTAVRGRYDVRTTVRYRP